MLPKSVTDKLDELAAAMNRETALGIVQQLWDIIHGIIPGFPAWEFSETDTLGQIQAKAWNDTAAIPSWPQGDD